MSFRPTDDDGIASARWLAKNKSVLTAAGIPSEVVNSERTWNYTLLHGDDELQSGWQAEWLSPQQAETLLALIMPYLGSSIGCDLVRRLQAVARQNESAASRKGGD
jgi:hypothetical protein